jgi:ADP-L-glycero-D-manno-heptose 6-epimerase
MEILVTGHEGFIGSNMTKRLYDLGHIVDGYEWGDSYPDLKKYEKVIHMGAISSTTETDVEKIMKQNYEFSVELLNKCDFWDIDFQFSSSASIYGLQSNFTEISPVDPRTPYAWSKYLFERYVTSKKWNNRVQCFRYFNVYGEGEDHKGSQASPFHQFTKQAKELGEIRVFKNSETYRRDFISVEDVIDTQIKFLNKGVSGIFNIGTGKTLSFLDVATKIANQYNVDIVEIDMPEQLKHSYQVYTCADMTKTNDVLR